MHIQIIIIICFLLPSPILPPPPPPLLSPPPPPLSPPPSPLPPSLLLPLSHQSIDPSIRREVWKYLLGYFPFSISDEDRMELQKRKEEEYHVIKRQWQSFTSKQEKNFHRWRELKQLVGW